MKKRSSTGLSADQMHRLFPQAACMSHLVFYGGRKCSGKRASRRKICDDCAEIIASSIGWKSTGGWTRKREEERQALLDQVADLNEQLYEANKRHSDLLASLDQAPAQRKRGQRATDGTIYALLSGYNVKVGWTGRDLQERLREYPPSTQLLVHFPAARGEETRIKRKFAHLKTHGNEWLPYAPQVTEWVDQMIREHGEPDPDITCGPAKYQVPRPHADKMTARPRDYRGKIA